MTPVAPVVATPRWERRAFGDRFPVVERWLEAAPYEVKDTEELYLLGPRADLNAKLRNGLLDVKQRLACDRGLELWRPVLKAPFPLDRPGIAALFGLWHLQAPALARGTYTTDQFINEVIRDAPVVRVVHVAKHRRTTAFGGCLVELADLAVDDRPVRTAAVESEDPESVLRLAGALGLDGRENVSYVGALRRLVHGQTT
jgi:hypothetical protein